MRGLEVGAKQGMRAPPFSIKNQSGATQANKY